MDQAQISRSEHPLPTEDPKVAATLDQNVYAGFFQNIQVERILEQVVATLLAALFLGAIAYVLRDAESAPAQCTGPEPLEQTEQTEDPGPKPKRERTTKVNNDVYDI